VEVSHENGPGRGALLELRSGDLEEQGYIAADMGRSKLCFLFAQQLTYRPFEGGGGEASACSSLGRELGHNPIVFASLSSKLDMIEHLKREAKETCEEKRE
jgi:hypothetical protein